MWAFFHNTADQRETRIQCSEQTNNQWPHFAGYLVTAKALDVCDRLLRRFRSVSVLYLGPTRQMQRHTGRPDTFQFLRLEPAFRFIVTGTLTLYSSWSTQLLIDVAEEHGGLPYTGVTFGHFATWCGSVRLCSVNTTKDCRLLSPSISMVVGHYDLRSAASRFPSVSAMSTLL